MSERFIRREDPAPGVARVVLARPETRNAQHPELLYELDAAFAAAAADSAVKVIVLAADGPDFSSGHDLRAGCDLPGGPAATIAAVWMPGARRAITPSSARPTSGSASGGATFPSPPLPKRRVGPSP